MGKGRGRKICEEVVRIRDEFVCDEGGGRKSAKDLRIHRAAFACFFYFSIVLLPSTVLGFS